MKLSTVLFIKRLIDEEVDLSREIMNLEHSKYVKSVSHKCPSSEIESNKQAYMESLKKHIEICYHKRSFENGNLILKMLSSPPRG